MVIEKYRGKIIVSERKHRELEAQLKQAQAVLRELAEFRTERVILNRESDHYSEVDQEAPFFSEAFLYTLLGKEDARSVLSRLRSLCLTLGITDHVF